MRSTTFRNSVVGICAAACLARPALTHTQSGPSGTWRVDVSGQSVPWEAVLRTDGSNLSGAVSMGATIYAAEIYDGVTDGKTVAFRFDMAGARPRRIKMTGTVVGDTIDSSGNRSRGLASQVPILTIRCLRTTAPRRITAKRAPDAADRVAELAAHVRQTPHVTFDRILHAEEEPQNWLTFSGTVAGWRYSRLSQLTPENVNRLELAWLWQRPETGGLFEATPLVVDGVSYRSKRNDVVALDAATGACFGYINTPDEYRAHNTNRGLAILGGARSWARLTLISLQ